MINEKEHKQTHTDKVFVQCAQSQRVQSIRLPSHVWSNRNGKEFILRNRQTCEILLLVYTKASEQWAMAIGQMHRVQFNVTVNETHAEQKHEKKPFLFPKCCEREK